MSAGQPTPLRQERTTEDRDWTALTTPVLTLAIQALEERVLLWVVTLGAGAIWGYTVTHPDLLRIGAAGLYSLTVFLPMLWRRR